MSLARLVARPAHKPWVWLVIIFLLSRAAFFVCGVRFDLRPLDTSWHIVDPIFLRERLLESAFYTPGQPPLYNLLLGAVLKVSSDSGVVAALLQALYGAMALGTGLLLLALLQRLSISAWTSLMLSALFMLSPALVLYESLPYYTVPCVLLLTSIVWLFRRMLESPSPRRAAWLFFAMATLIYTRSMFQIQWMLVLFGFCALVMPGQRRKLLYALLLPLSLVLGLYAKNAAITGHFATSSWLGMSIIKLTVHPLPLELREEAVQAGELSRFALRDSTFNPPEQEAEAFAATPITGIAVLDQTHKSTGHANYHHLAYAKVSARAMSDSLYAIRHHPAAYLRSVGEASLMFYRPASDYPYVKENREAIEGWSRLYARYVAGQPSYPTAPKFAREPGQMGYLIMVAHLLCVGFGAFLLARFCVRRRLSLDDATLLFMWLQIMYVTLVGNAFEIGENQRFRLYLHPLMVCMLAVLSARVFRAARSRRRPLHSPEPRTS